MTEHSGDAIEKKMAEEKYNFLFEKAAIPATLTKIPESEISSTGFNNHF